MEIKAISSVAATLHDSTFPVSFMIKCFCSVLTECFEGRMGVFFELQLQTALHSLFYLLLFYIFFIFLFKIVFQLYFCVYYTFTNFNKKTIFMLLSGTSGDITVFKNSRSGFNFIKPTLSTNFFVSLYAK